MTNRGGRVTESGQSLVISVLFFGVLLGMATLVIDGGSYFWTKRSIQGDADAAALAAARDMPQSTLSAEAAARDYAEVKNSDDATLESFTGDPSNMSAKVVLRTDAVGPFSGIAGMDGTTIRARATARTAQVLAIDAILPYAALAGTLEFGDPPIPEKITVEPGGIKSGHIGAIAPPISAPECDDGTGNNAGEYQAMIQAAHNNGTMIACGTDVDDQVETAVGARPLATKNGFNARFGTNDGTHSDTFTDVVSWDAGIERFQIDKPDSPRIGFIPIISTGGSENDWGDLPGTSTTVTVVDYVMVYIGLVGAPGEPAYLTGANCLPTPCPGTTVQVWLTPIRSTISPNFDYELRDDWDPESDAPTAITLVE